MTFSEWNKQTACGTPNDIGLSRLYWLHDRTTSHIQGCFYRQASLTANRVNVWVTSSTLRITLTYLFTNVITNRISESGDAIASVRPSVCIDSYLLNRLTFDPDLTHMHDRSSSSIEHPDHKRLNAAVATSSEDNNAHTGGQALVIGCRL